MSNFECLSAHVMLAAYVWDRYACFGTPPCLRGMGVQSDPQPRMWKKGSRILGCVSRLASQYLGKARPFSLVFSTFCVKPSVQSLTELVHFLLVQVSSQNGPPSYLQLLVLPGWLWGAVVPFQWPGAQSLTTHQHIIFAASPERFPCLGRRSASGNHIQCSDHVKSGKKRTSCPRFTVWQLRQARLLLSWENRTAIHECYEK